MAMNVTISHIDTCLPCYLTDHHNRDGECLIGIPVDGSTTYDDLLQRFMDEARQDDRIPEGITDEMLMAAANECWAEAEPEDLFDPSLETGIEDGEGPHAWLLIEWDDDDEEARERKQATLRAERAEAALREARHLIDVALGDTDPQDPDHPLVRACQIVSAALQPQHEESQS